MSAARSADRRTVGIITRSLSALVIATAAFLVPAMPAQAWTQDTLNEWRRSEAPPSEFPPVNSRTYEDSIGTYSLNGVLTYELNGVEEMESTESDGDETTISLNTDILFEPDAWDIPDAAGDRIAELVNDIPQGAEVEVSGHTDSVIGAVDNQVLSENRAKAVAAIISNARPDLVLEVAGYANTKPAEREDPEDPSTYAANRRVEIIYEG